MKTLLGEKALLLASVFMILAVGGSSCGSGKDDSLTGFRKLVREKNVNKLIKKLDSDVRWEREAAVSAFSRLDGVKDAERAVPALIERVGKEDSLFIKSLVIEALGKIGDSRAVPVLKELGEARALSDIAARGIDKKAKQTALDALLGLGKSEDEKIRARVAWALDQEEFADAGQVSEYLCEAAADPSPKIRRAAVHSIPCVMGKRGKQTLEKLLQDPVKQIEAWAAIAITEMGDKSCLPTLEKVMFNENYREGPRFECLLALKHVSGEEVNRILKRWMIEMKGQPNPCLGTARSILSKKGVTLPWPPHKAAEYLIKQKEESDQN